MTESSDTLIDMEFRNGALCKKIRHADGRTEFVPIDRTGVDSFDGVETRPQEWRPAQTEVLERRALTRDQHIDRSCRVEAVLVKYCGPRMKEPGSTIYVNSQLLKLLLVDLCNALGGEWLETAKHITVRE